MKLYVVASKSYRN